MLRPPSRDRPAKLTKSNIASGSCAPARVNRRVAKLDLYLSKSQRRNSCASLRQAMEPPLSAPAVKDVKRWDGNQRTTQKWDSVRKVNSIAIITSKLP